MYEEAVLTDLRQEFEYYLANQENLVKSYNGKFIVIRDREVVGVFDSELQAVTEAQKRFALGTFLVQKVEPGAASYTQVFHSRVAFS